MSYDPTGPISTGNYPPPRKSRAGLVVAVVAGAVALLCVVGAIAVAAFSAPEVGEAPGISVTTPEVTPNPLTGGTPDRGAKPTPAALTVKDFQVTLKITGKDCIDFETIPDSCSYTYEVRLAIADPDAYKAAGDSYSITYGVKGLKGGEQVDTIEVDGDGQFTQFPGFGTAGPRASLKVRVIDVERRP